ncbi:MAG: hypothetical protein OXT67_11195 [Zetaproteobacteria bacterium]|nr:hypothetical protein [Zetaproteobacteria bacterium]
MKDQAHLFIIDPLEKLNKSMDTSLGIACALRQRGASVWAASWNSLVWSVQEDQPLLQECYELDFPGEALTAACAKQESTAVGIARFSHVHLRANPPFDLRYSWLTWALDAAARLGVTVWNSPQLLRDFNEKAGILQYPRDIPPTMVATQVLNLVDFMAHGCRGDAVIKPLDQYGGIGVRRLRTQDKSCQEVLRQLTHEETLPLMVQRFLPEIEHGEVRAFAVAGEPLAWCLKVPQPGEFRANTGHGSKLVAYTPSSLERERVARIARELYQLGAMFIGFDLIGELVTEINLTSPRLLLPAGQSESYAQVAARLAVL